MDCTRKQSIGLATLLIVSFAILLAMGGEIHRKAPPMPDRAVGPSGEIAFTRADSEQGRIVWQSIGGMQLGSIWGHGSYVAPDRSADWLHREAVALADISVHRETGADFAELGEEQQAAMAGRLRTALRTNKYDAASGVITLDTGRIAAISNVAAHYESLFGNDPSTATLPEAHAIKNDTMPVWNTVGT